MRSFVSLIVLGAACSTAPAPAPPPDAAIDVAADTPADSGVQCPVPLGTARPRTAQPVAGPLDDTLRMNQIQLKATHNSYHLRPPDTLGIQDWNYNHAPLDVQLDQQGVRGVELDLHWDPYCERYEVYHLGTVDELTTCRLFTQCLEALRTWSDAHPSHHPLFVHLEPKDDLSASQFEARFTSIEREILSVFTPELVITPHEVQGASATLAEAIRARGWPTLRATRGRVLFYIDRHDAFRTAYTHNGHDLDGRIAFIDSEITDPFAGVLVLNDPTRVDAIQAAVRANFIVRVLSWDASDLDATHSPDVVLPTGAQIVSTDYPVMVPGMTQWVDIAGGTPSRCDPLNAPSGCTSAAIESLPR